MYVPISFQIQARDRQLEFIRRYGFATLITTDGRTPSATHLPVLLEEHGESGRQVAHIARANPQWQPGRSGSA